jgi:8-amino-3,8-dideoxy-alpha-D-manno-octulosonate transaminase
MKICWPNEFPGVYWIDKREEEAVLDVLRNGSLFRYYGLGEPDYPDNTGKPSQVDKFEAKAQKLYDTAYPLGMNSGTGALLTAMRALDVGAGCEVIVPSFLWVATVGAVVQVGAIPVICEIDETFNLDLEDLEKKINSRTKLIIPIHMAGAPCEMDGLMAIANKYGVAVLEDCAQCNGGKFNGKSVGTFGKMGIFSLQLNKNITSGEGGLLITDDEQLYLRAFAAHDMGLIRVNGRLATPDDDALMWGSGRRMSELCGAVAAVQMDKLPSIVAKMHESKYRMREQLQAIPGIELRRIPDEVGDSSVFIIIMVDSADIAIKMAEKMKANGLKNIHRLADYGLHIYSNIPSLVNKIPLSSAGEPGSLAENSESIYNYAQGACPQSDKLFARSIILPVPSCLTEELEQQAVEIIKTALAESM